jgi:hypothetical protein
MIIMIPAKMIQPVPRLVGSVIGATPSWSRRSDVTTFFRLRPFCTGMVVIFDGFAVTANPAYSPE